MPEYHQLVKVATSGLGFDSATSKPLPLSTRCKQSYQDNKDSKPTGRFKASISKGCLHRFLVAKTGSGSPVFFYVWRKPLTLYTPTVVPLGWAKPLKYLDSRWMSRQRSYKVGCGRQGRGTGHQQPSCNGSDVWVWDVM
jgi:hypothetical protein